MTHPLTICYFGAFDLNYPRNQVLRMGLEAEGVRVVLCNVPKSWPTLRKMPHLIAQYVQVWQQCDGVLLAEFGQSLTPLAWLLTRLTRRWLITDLLVSYYDMAVDVRQEVRPGSFSARRYWWLDALGVRLADAALTDAEPHRQYFIETFGGKPEKVHVLPLGVNTAHFTTPANLPPQNENGRLLVQYYGSYTPAHGVLTLVQAAAKLANHPNLRFEFIGQGQQRVAAEALAAELRLNNLTFRDGVPYAALPAEIARADICLGEFGDTPQTKRGLANKVYQTLAMGKPLIAGDSPSLRSLFTPGLHLLTTPLAEAEPLAAAIAELAADPERRAALGQAGQAHVRQNFSPQPLAHTLMQISGGIRS